MPLPQILDAQRDFSAGELDPDLKRRDDLPLMRAGARQMADWRALNSGQIEQRPGRRYLFGQTGRVDEIEVSPGVIYRLCFGSDGSLKIRDSSGAIVATSGSTYPWAANTIDQIVWSQVKISSAQTDAVICFSGMQPVIASYNGAWSFGTFSFAAGTDGIRGSAFLRLVKPGATMTPSAGGDAGTSVSLVMSDDVFLPAHVGVLFRFANSRMQITAVTDTKHATATLLETMNPVQQLTIADRTGGVSAPRFLVGQAVNGSITAASGVVVAVNYGSSLVDVQLLSGQSGFSTSDVLVGPTTTAAITAISNLANPIACAVWDEEIISAARGWPNSCFTDRGRLGFCDIAAAPDAIMWSATDTPYYFAVGANATDAMVEIVAGKPHVYHVGPWFDELVFTSKGIYYVPIGSTNSALKPGSVEFRPITNEPSSSAKPAFTSEGFLYVKAGKLGVNMVVGSGAAYSTRPYVVSDVTQFHKHLFTGTPKAIAVSTGDGQYPERYAYVLNADGTLVVGRFEPGKQMGWVPQPGWIGWMPWKGAGVYSWVSALFSTVLFTVSYGGVGVTESLDDTIYLDCAQPISGANTAPWLAVGTVTVMDGVNTLGPHLVDANGNVVKTSPGEDLSSPTILVGFPFQPTLEPFLPNAEPGPDSKQRTRRRRISKVEVSVMNSTGFFFAKLYSGRSGAHLPIPGTVTGGRRISAYNQGDDQSVAPPLREEKYAFRGPVGHNYDPRFAIIKDTAGPLRISEIGMEAST